MTDELWLRRKLTLRAGSRQVVLVKHANERTAHVVMKALIWALYLPQYPQADIERPIGDRYKPDVVMLNDQGQPVFWGEAGHVSPDKIRSLGKRFRETHLAVAKWGQNLRPHLAVLEKALAGIRRTAPLDLLAFPEESASRFIDDDGRIHIAHDQIEWIRLPGSST